MVASATNAYVAFCTAPDRDIAEAIARACVEASAAACVNILGNVKSIYRWKGEIQADDEVQLVFKTTREKLPKIEQILRTLHPYEVPEFIAWPIDRGLPEYLSWVVREAT